MSIKEFRKAFSERYSGLVASGEFAATDYDRLMSDDAYCNCFAGAARAGNLEARLQLAEACLRWRCQDQISGLTEADFPLEALQKGSVFFHSEDREGHPILYFRIQDSGKTSPDELLQIRQFIGWLLDSRHRRQPEQKVSLLFDMTNAGVANLNLDLVRFVVRAFQVYYPGLLGYLFVYEMPWVLTAAWKVIRSWLDKEAQKRIIFLKRSNVQEYIAPDKLWVHMGGTDDYQYEYSPGMLTGDTAEYPTSGDECGDVEFVDAENSMQVSLPLNEADAVSLDGSQTQSFKIRSPAASSASLGSSSYIGRYMSISPADQVTFRLATARNNNSSDCQRTITLTSTWQQSALAYKVKTTCPADYRVKPSVGLLEPGASVCVVVTYRPSSTPPSQPPARSDKLQLLAAPVESGLSREACQEALKSAPSEALMEHRLRCRVETPKPAAGSSAAASGRLPDDQQLAALRSEVSRLSGMVSRLAVQQSQRLAYTKYSLWLLAFGVIFLAFLLGWSCGRQAASSSHAGPPHSAEL
ncbi:hypothetical protein BOX15_Mlig001845g2 [Macrostomum lignano]|uniref:Motile sperm domain-containing protein 2 n=1 Tax=Macrostomum lignano TaxID=282301 RepID=A0A267GPD7_9PLAT|nr:hypothetical protein BOX15_Mlig001845g2 [Macrostomum lignano]